MQAIVVTPRQARSGRVEEVPTPHPGPGQVLVKTLDVGVCGTDIEILNGEYGEAPPGEDYLILGHENFGQVVEADDGGQFAEGDHVVCVVRRPDPVPCAACAAGEFDMCSNGQYTERGIKGRHGFMAEDIVDKTSNRAKMVEACGATYVKGDETSLLQLSEQLGDHIDLIVEATAVPQIVFDAMDAVGPNGVVALTGVSAGTRKLEVAGAHLNFEMVLMNKVVFGSVNANKRYFASAVTDLARFEELWPGLCEQLITRRVPYTGFQDALAPRPGIDVKSTISFR